MLSTGHFFYTVDILLVTITAVGYTLSGIFPLPFSGVQNVDRIIGPLRWSYHLQCYNFEPTPVVKKKKNHVIRDFHMHILVKQLGQCLISSPLLSNCSWRTPASTKRHRSFLSDLPAHTISPLVLSSPPLLSPAHLYRATPPLYRSGTPNRSRSDALYRGPLTPRML